MSCKSVALLATALRLLSCSLALTFLGSHVLQAEVCTSALAQPWTKAISMKPVSTRLHWRKTKEVGALKDGLQHRELNARPSLDPHYGVNSRDVMHCFDGRGALGPWGTS